MFAGIPCQILSLHFVKNISAWAIILLFFLISPGTSSAQFAKLQWHQTEGPYGGDIFQLAADPNTGRIWANVNFWFYYSDDHGDNWTAAGIWSNRSPDFVFPGNDVTIIGGHRSIDNGTTWQEMVLPDSASMRSVAYDKANKLLFSAAIDGIYASSDLGDSWAKVSHQKVERLKTTSNGKLFATHYDDGQLEMLGSINLGRTWERVTLPGKILWDVEVFSDSLLYVTVSYPFNSNQTYQYSVDGGKTWQPVGGGVSSCLGAFLVGTTSTRQLLALNGLTAVQISMDDASCSTLYAWESEFTTYPGGTGEMRQDVDLAMVDREDYIYVYSYSGDLIRSDDLGKTWKHLNMAGIKESTISDLSVNASGEEWAGSRGFGAFTSTNQGKDWIADNLEADHVTALHAGQTPGTVWVSTFEEGLFRSKDYGETWDWAYEPERGGYLRGYIEEMKYSAATDTYFARSNYGVYYSKNEGDLWLPVNVPSPRKVHRMTLGPEGDLYIVLDYGSYRFEILRTKDNGLNWDLIYKYGNTNYRFPSILEMDVRGRLWTEIDEQVTYSDDQGETWHVNDLKGRLRDLQDTPDGSLWIVGQYGVARSMDGGETWRYENMGLEDDCVVFEIEWNQVTSELLVGVWRSGVYRAFLDTSYSVFTEEMKPTGSTNLQLSSYPNPITTNSHLTLNLPHAGAARLLLYDQLGREVKTIFNKNLPVGRHNLDFDFSQLAPGLYFYHLETSSERITHPVIKID